MADSLFHSLRVGSVIDRQPDINRRNFHKSHQSFIAHRKNRFINVCFRLILSGKKRIGQHCGAFSQILIVSDSRVPQFSDISLTGIRYQIPVSFRL